jgi:hypothetical protein
MNNLNSKLIILIIITKKDNFPFNSLFFYLKDRYTHYTLEVPAYKLNQQQNYFEFFLYFNNKNIFRDKIKINKFFGILHYIILSLSSVKKLLSVFNKPKVDIIIFDTLNTFLISLIYKILNPNVKLIFSDGDIIPTRYYDTYFFGNKKINYINNYLISRILILIKYFAIKLSIFIINTHKKTVNWNKNKITKNFNTYFLPYSFNLSIFDEFSKNKKKSNKFLYMGNLSFFNGFDDIINLSSKLKYQYKLKHKFYIIGGEKEKILFYKKKILSMSLTEEFIFLGFVKNIYKISNIVKSCSLGFAPYKILQNEKSFVINGKIIDYLNFSLPILTTEYSSFSNIIKKKKLGTNVKSVDDMVKFILKLNKNERFFNLLLKNITNFVNSRDEIKIYDNLFKKISKTIKLT